MGGLNYKQMKADALSKKKKIDSLNNQNKKEKDVEAAAKPKVQMLK